MKAQTKDAVAMAMDWLAQLREEEGAEPPRGVNNSVIDSAPAASELGEAAPATPDAAGFGDAAPAVPPAAGYWSAAPPAVDWEDAPPAAPHADDVGDAVPAVPPAAGYWSAAPPAVDWEDARPAAPPADWEHAAPAVPPETTPPGQAGMKANIEITERAAIGDELRIPLAWCEMGSCISHYTDPAALGEADIRTRAIAAGWRVDALGRLACPQCQQGDALFWTAHPVALWDRDRAVAMTALMAAAMRQMAGADRAAGMGRSTSLRRQASASLGRERAAALGGLPGSVPGQERAAVPGPRPEMARQPGRGRHRGHPAHPDRVQ